MSSNALAQRGSRETLSPFARMEAIFDERDRNAIAQFVGVPADNAAFIPFLAVAASYGLDPVSGEIWLIKQKGRDGQNARYRPAAGRDGFLKHGLRDPLFLGVEGDVVRANDTFKTIFRNHQREIIHEVNQGPTLAGGDAEARLYRGPITGAWACVYRKGKRPQYFHAPLDEHMRDPEKSAWSYTSAMILKSAQSMALRLAYSISGVVPVDEMTGDAALMPEERQEAMSAKPEPLEIDYGADEDPELAERTERAVKRANELEPLAYTGVKLNMLLGGQPHEKRVAFLDMVERENVEREARAEKDAAEAEVVTDAVVVDDGSAPADGAPAPGADAPDKETADTIDKLQHEAADLLLLLEGEITEENKAEIMAARARVGEIENDLRALGGAMPGA